MFLSEKEKTSAQVHEREPVISHLDGQQGSLSVAVSVFTYK